MHGWEWFVDFCWLDAAKMTKLIEGQGVATPKKVGRYSFQ